MGDLNLTPNVGFITALLGGLSGPQTLIAKGIGALVIGGVILGAVKYHAKTNFDKGVASKAVYISTLEKDLGAALSDALEKKALLENCQTERDKAQGAVTAHLKQNADAAKLASETLLETQKNNAAALAAANRNSAADKAFYASLEERMKGLTNECDANGNSVVVGGADLLRDIRDRRKK